MSDSEFSISITAASIEVRHIVSIEHPHAKLFGAICTSCISLLALACLLFLPGKHGDPSMWHDMATAPLGSADFIFPLTLIVLAGAYLSGLTIRYAVAAWPSDEILRCDGEHLVISRVPWLDFRNRTWTTKSYPINSITEMRFAAVASARATSIRGLRFLELDRRRKTLPGLKAPEAHAILVALQRLGVAVVLDAMLDEQVREANATSFGDTSWMDRSWMTHPPTASELGPEQPHNRK